MDKILFIDRDGVINNDDRGYTHKYNEVTYNYDLLDYIKEHFNDYIKIIVTNQAGIAKELYTEEDFKQLMICMLRDLEQYGIGINKVYHAPHLSNSNHPDRKPNPGMITRGLEKYKVKPKYCTMIGDRISDYQAAKNAKLGRFIYYVKGVFSEAEI